MKDALFYVSGIVFNVSHVPSGTVSQLRLIRHHQNSGKLSELSEVLNLQYYLTQEVNELWK